MGGGGGGGGGGGVVGIEGVDNVFMAFQKYVMADRDLLVPILIFAGSNFRSVFVFCEIGEN